MNAVLLVLYAICDLLSLRAIVDVFSPFGRQIFPAWFQPVFAVFTLGLLSVTALVVVRTLRAPAAAPTPPPQARALWTVYFLSYVAVASLHKFYPFRSDIQTLWSQAQPILRLNLAMIVVGMLAALTWAQAYFREREAWAIRAVLVLQLLWLVPNDDCGNPFNTWWVQVIGASPLMFLPNAFVGIFVVAGLRGVWPRANLMLAAGVTLATLVLGLGHIYRFIW